jgi:hypothetical protein
MNWLPRRRAAVCALYGVIAAVFCAPLFERPNGLGISDWDQHLFYYGSVLKNLIEYGQPPFWNPWYCGGNVLWQNPQIAILSPVYPLTVVLSLALAMKVNIVLHYWVGLVGMHLLLTRIIRLSHLPFIVYLASMFTLAGANALHLNAGHSVFLPSFYLPLMLFFFLRSLLARRVRDALLGGLVLALMVYNGGLHIVPMAIVVVGAIALVTAAMQRAWQPIALALVLGVAAFGYAAPKILPVAQFVTGDRFWDTRPPTAHPDQMTMSMLVRAYVDPYQTRSTKVDDLQRHGWYEYGNFVGSLAALLTLASLVSVVASRSTPDRWLGVSLALTTAVVLALEAGEFSATAPASLMHVMPLFSSFRIPSRYTIVVALLAPMTIAWVTQSMSGERLMTPRTRWFSATLCSVAILELLLHNRAQFRGVFPFPPLDHEFQWLAGSSTLTTDSTTNAYGPNSPMLHALVDGRSFYNCYESLQLRRTADAEHPLISSDGPAKIFDMKFSPNRIQFSATAGPEASRIVLNQNYAEGWSSTAGPIAREPRSEKPSVLLAPGQAGKFSFVFTPPGLWLGLGLLAATAVASAALIYSQS